MSLPPGLRFEYSSGCLIVHATGEAQFEQRVAFAEAIADALTKQPVAALLVNLRETAGPATFMDRFHLGELAARYLPKIPVAVLMREEQTDKQLIGQLVARNRGLNLEIFLNADAAQEWLRKHAAPGA